MGEQGGEGQGDECDEEHGVAQGFGGGCAKIKSIE